jgi:hypothetical protein
MANCVAVSSEQLRELSEVRLRGEHQIFARLEHDEWPLLIQTSRRAAQNRVLVAIRVDLDEINSGDLVPLCELIECHLATLGVLRDASVDRMMMAPRFGVSDRPTAVGHEL